MKQWLEKQQGNWNKKDIWKITAILGMTMVLIAGSLYQHRRTAGQTVLYQEGVTAASDTETGNSETQMSESQSAETQRSEVQILESQSLEAQPEAQLSEIQMLESQSLETQPETQTSEVQILEPQLSEEQLEAQLSESEPPVFTPSEVYLELNAGAAALLDADNKRVLYEKNGREHRAMASTTKIMTCLLALELGNQEDVVTFSANAAAQPDVQMNGCEGEEYYLRDLLYSLMLESHNDTAVAIAEHIGGSVEEFARLMNEKAQELGAYETNFVTPNGLDAEGHYTTACDLGLIACYAIQNPEFLAIVQTPAYTFQELHGARSVSVTNKDAFLTSYDGAMGIKTGFTGEAGYCFVGAARRDGKTFVSVVLASGWPPHRTYKWTDTHMLMDYGMNQYAERTILDSGYRLPTIPVQNGIEAEETELYIEDRISLLMREAEQVQYMELLPAELEAPVRKGEIAGTLEVYIDGTLYDSVVVYIGQDITPIDYRYTLQKIFRQYFLFSQATSQSHACMTLAAAGESF